MIWFPENDLHTHDGVAIPGTVHIVDLDHHMHVEHGKKKDIVLVPQPSDHPDDPLNWKTWRKHLTLFWALWYVFAIAVLAAVPAIGYPSYAKELGISEDNLISGTGYLFLFFGIGCMFWQPFALNFGRRPVFLYTLMVSGIACPIWMNYVHNTGEYYANRIICGFFGSSVESLAEVVIADLFFVHERALGLAFYLAALYFGSYLGPLAGSFVNGGQGWQWINIWVAIISAIGVVGTFFLMEESMFYRKKNERMEEVEAEVGDYDNQYATSHRTSQEQPEVVNTGSHGEELSEETNEKSPSPLSDRPVPDEKGLATSSTIDQEEASYGIVEDQRIHSTSPRKTLLQKYPIFFHRQPEQKMDLLNAMIRPFKIFVYFFPVVWSGLIVASGLAWWSVLGATVATILMGEPYNFGTTGLGLIYIAPTITTIVCLYIGGPLSDKLSLWLARRNNGIQEPEFRLYIGIVALFFAPFGLWLYGIGAAHGISWVALAFGYAFATVGVNIGASVPYAYAMDCYPRLAGDSMVVIIMVRNVIGAFAFNYAITPWIARDGLQNTFIILGFLSIAFWLSSIPMIIYGKRLRRWSAKRYLEYAKNTSH